MLLEVHTRSTYRWLDAHSWLNWWSVWIFLCIRPLNVCTFHNSFSKRYGLLAWITSKCTCCLYEGSLCGTEKQNNVFADWARPKLKQNVKHIKEDGGNRRLYGYQGEKELIVISRQEVLRVLREEISYNADDDKNEMKWNESGFRPPLCTYRLNWAKRTSWGWWDDWDDTVLQTQDSKFEPWRSEAEHATSRSRRLPTILTFTRGWGRNIFVSFKPPRPGTEPRTLAWKAAVLTTTLVTKWKNTQKLHNTTKVP